MYRLKKLYRIYAPIGVSGSPTPFGVKNHLVKVPDFNPKEYVFLTPIGVNKNSSQQQQIIQNILQHTKVSKDHLTPEIALHLITNECPLYHAPISEESEKVFPNDPFWGFYWPGGQAISRYILEHGELVRNKSVLDVGSGCGASSLAAVMSGAKYAVANDIDEAAGFAAHLNASLNLIPSEAIQICLTNLIGAAITEDIILLGDVFYDEEFAEVLIPWLLRLQRDGKTILIGDPGRHGLTTQRLKFMVKLATYKLTDNCCIENNGFKFVNVWRFK